MNWWVGRGQTNDWVALEQIQTDALYRCLYISLGCRCACCVVIPSGYLLYLKDLLFYLGCDRLTYDWWATIFGWLEPCSWCLLFWSFLTSKFYECLFDVAGWHHSLDRRGSSTSWRLSWGHLCQCLTRRHHVVEINRLRSRLLLHCQQVSFAFKDCNCLVNKSLLAYFKRFSSCIWTLRGHFLDELTSLINRSWWRYIRSND